MNQSRTARVRRGAIIVLVVLGFVLILLAMTAELLGLDLTPGFGMIQMFSFLLGLTSLTAAASGYLYSRRPKDAPHSLQADIGVRLVATGLVFAWVTGLSDLIGIGTHVIPQFERPFAGPLQLGGVVLGVLVIVAGLALYYTSRGIRDISSMEFLVGNRRADANPDGQPEPEVKP